MHVLVCAILTAGAFVTFADEALAREICEGSSVPGVIQNEQEALRWAQSAIERWIGPAAEAGDAAALTMLVLWYGEVSQGTGNEEKLFNSIHALVAQDVLWAQYVLGHLYFYGDQGFEQDEEEAGRWLRIAAERGFARAQFELGQLLHDSNTSEAVKWYRLAALQNCLPAQCSLSDMYSWGKHVPQDLPEAYAWASLASRHEHGEELLASPLSIAKEQMTPEQVREGDRRAEQYALEIQSSK
jgi:TPR repeat protein